MKSFGPAKYEIKETEQVEMKEINETKEYYEVVNKGKTPSSKGGTGYYIIVNIEDEEFRMKVEKVVYFEYEIGDNILLYKYNGALGYSYYEYQMNSIYIYNNE